MENLLEYKGCYGKVSYLAADEIFCGEILLAGDLVTFEGDNAADLKKAFEEAADHYVGVCEKLGRDPQKTFQRQV